MSQSTSADTFQVGLWPQQDARDPLGVWAARLGVTGDATGGEIKVQISVPADRRAAHIYTCYSANISGLVIAGATTLLAQCRLLTNWPDISSIAGVQGYSSNIMRTLQLQGGGTSPEGSTIGQLVQPSDRFLLLFDPRPQPGSAMPILELKLATQVDGDTYTFEAYGYFWDREVLDTPGGPRHPGAN